MDTHSAPFSSVALTWARVERLPAAAELALLGADEREQAARLRFQRDRKRFLSRRVLLRRVLGAWLERDPAGLEFTREPGGRPWLPEAPRLGFNLSHSAGWALVGVAEDLRVGVDLEARLPEGPLEPLARRILAPAELRSWSGLPAAEQSPALLRTWVRKEAILKATGEGLGIEPDRLSIGSIPDCENGPRTGLIQGRPNEEWAVFDLEPDPEGLLPPASVAAAGSNWRPERLRPWSSPGSCAASPPAA